MMKWLKVGAVIFGALVITALGIDAADTLSGSRSTLLGQVISSGKESVCPDGMVQIPMAESFTCVDIFESSTDKTCPHQNPINEIETRENLESVTCKAASEPKKDTWRFITREQAQTACIKAGKRLPKSDEWYMVSVGTLDSAQGCNTNSSGPHKTDADGKCVSALGVHDTIGNVWEWTSDDVINGRYQGRDLPESGYVVQVDSQGVAVLSNTVPSDLFYSDYFWSSHEGVFGMMRGGFYGSKSDAGVYAVHAQTLPTTAGTAIGFRCVL